jgi:hypothetical protein
MKTDAVMCIGVMSASPSRMPLCASAALDVGRDVDEGAAALRLHPQLLPVALHDLLPSAINGLWQVAWLMPVSIAADPASTAFSLG